MTSETVSDVVAQRIKEVREKRGVTATQLAERCAELGMPHLSAATLSNIETGRRKDGKRTRNVTVDELMTLATALEVAPVHLLVPPAIRASAAYWITPARRVMALDARDFVCGMQPLGVDRMGYFAEAPDDHFFQFTVMPDRQLGRRTEYAALTKKDVDPDRVRRTYEQPAPVPDWVLEEGNDLEEGAEIDGSGG